jgi:hypothetical protein
MLEGQSHALQALIIAGFVLVHVFAGKLRFLSGIPRSVWLSLAGGLSVAYVFMHVFPELREAQTSLVAAWRLVPFIANHAYLIALCGLVLFYALERVVKSARRRGNQGSETGETPAGRGIFWLHISSFAIYNALIGYLLVHREEQDLRGLLLFGVAMGLHFIVNDYGLREDHRNTYRRVGRWILAAAVLIGWIAGLATELSRAAIGVLFAFLAGGVILNVLKEELPEERQSRFAPFALGAALYAVLLLLP